MIRSIPPRKYAGPISGVFLATLFALFALLFNTVETLIPWTEVRPGAPAPVSVRLPSTYFRLTLLRNEVHFLTTTSSTCPNIIPRGEVLQKSSECAGLAQAFESHRRHRGLFHYIGLFSFYFFMALIWAGFMRSVTMRRARLLRAQVGLFGLVIVCMGTAKAVLLFTGLPAIVTPVLFAPMLAGLYFRRRVALSVVSVVALSVASLNNFDIAVLLVLSVAGLIASLASRGRARHIRTLLKAGVLSGWVAVAGIVIVTLIRSGTLGVYDDPAEHFDPRYSLWIAAVSNGLLSSFLAVALSPSMGSVFGIVSRSRLVDLQDLNQRLLKRIQAKAPGTWEHSRAMANLAEAAVNAIGGNTSLVRVGAYYHDVGKSNAPDFFIENQGAHENPHDALEPEASAARIFKHVIDGAKLLRQEGIPEDVVEFCYSHHGTSVLEYFWYKTMSDGNPNDLSEKDFRYPGHKPSTRETGILMLVDAIEAGARTVDVPTKDAFSDLVRRIVFSKLSQGQLDESGLSLGDLRTVINTLVDTLVNMYHARIKYPWQTGDTSTNTKRTSSVPPAPDDEKDDDEPEAKASPRKAAAASEQKSRKRADATPKSVSTADALPGEKTEPELRLDPTPKPRPKRKNDAALKPPRPEDLEEPAWAMASREEEEVGAQEAVLMKDDESQRSEGDDDDAPEVLEIDREEEALPRVRPKRFVK